MEKFRNRPVNSKKGYLKWTSKPSYITQKIFYNELILEYVYCNYVKYQYINSIIIISKKHYGNKSSLYVDILTLGA